MNKTIISITALIVLTGILALFYLMQNVISPASNVDKNNTSQTSQQNLPPTATPIPLPTSTTKTDSSQGVVTAVSSNSISVDISGEIKTYALEKKVDVQKITSGSLTGGNVKTAQVTLSEVKVGNEVMFVINQGSSTVLSIFILN